MDIGNIITILTVIGGFITVFVFMEKRISKSALQTAAINALHSRLDECEEILKEREGAYNMAGQIDNTVKDHETRIRKIEDTAARMDENIKQVKKDTANINSKIDALLIAVNK